jgi:hypothetical protein
LRVINGRVVVWLGGQARSDQPEDLGSNVGRQGFPPFDHFGEVRGQVCGQGVGKWLLGLV